MLFVVFILLAIANESFGFIDDSLYDGIKYMFDVYAIDIKTVDKHLNTMRYLLVSNQRQSFNRMFRVDIRKAFPFESSPGEFFELAQRVPEFRNYYQVRLVSNPIPVSRDRVEFTYVTQYCKLVRNQCTKKEYRLKAYLSMKADSPSGFGFDQLYPA
ncbi:unnamed protein product [Caenorhabditis bovis]|uniref:Uncharacterized protein n=1 Tax=Caenorhabditis bovis TaxID=2654633 RepID=A0A8S1ELH8_9PELO|nr:unnamed protein product [Caenorhabditis bovis]